MTNKERLAFYLEAEKRILLSQSVETAYGEKLTLANLASVQSEIKRLQNLIANESRKRGVIRRNYLE
ncbi:hypothetical protein HC725_06320 [Vibrio sp. S17_S38]|uniref:hypothetical protein n=1 Tax=Vibrio sp. S17_S38 TaxID=2720229 RepID=UPI0016819C0F|nr:hypothetical protein [Vibrio sp. S17_S38]MBD1572894.1 hypothetical protein [Vibrio sp. S17_S38]